MRFLIPQVQIVDPLNPSGFLQVAIESPLESNGAIPVNVQDQHTRALDLYFIQQQAITTLAANASPGDTTLTLTSAVGFAVGDTVGLFTSTGQFYFASIVAVAAPIITVDTPLDLAYSIGDNIISATKNLAVSGTLASPQIFQVGPVGAGTGVDVDITRIMGSIIDDTAMDDAKFGGITALTNGLVLRVNNGTMQNIWNIKSNGEFGLLAFDIDYSIKAPAGSYGFRFRNTYAGQSKHGVTLRLEPGDKLELLVQDDLTGLDSFFAMAQGHIVTD